MIANQTSPKWSSTDATNVHTDGEPTIHIEHFFYIHKLEKVGLKLHETLLFCGARCYSNEPQLIYPELIRMFWTTRPLLKVEGD